ncbi:MAG: ribosome small subunit-dependent GTPase A [Proteobacteria bacterium]|nr:MAG: ribosome small subunit-dependent GTPase A [Pseudomonadota bacterium]
MSTDTHNTVKGTGRVITRFGAQVLVRCEDNTDIRCTPKRKLENVACGDWVDWQSNPTGTARIDNIHQRKNAITRTTYRGKPRTIAANVDQLIIVSAWLPEPFWDLVDRYIIAAELLNAEVVIVINKHDLAEQYAKTSDWEALSEYENIDYPVLHVNANSGEGIAQLKELIKGKTNILLGRSGVGKSSIANQIIPKAHILTAEISDSGEGRHTTTTADLYELGDDSYLIDSPGVRDYMPDNLDPVKLANGYREFRPYFNNCKFSNCTHNHEPQCAIRQSVEDGNISKSRYQRYLSALANL